MTVQRRNPEMQIVIPEYTHTEEVTTTQEDFDMTQRWLYERSLRREARQNLYNFVV